MPKTRLDLHYHHIKPVPTGVKFNMAAKLARGSKLLLMDSDAYPYNRHFLERMLSAYDGSHVLQSIQIKKGRPFANFSGCMMPTKIMREIKVDPRTILHYDTDWNFKLKRAGIGVKQVRDALIVHDQRKSWKTRFRRARIYGRGWAYLSYAHRDNPNVNFKWTRIGGSRIMEGLSIICVGIMTLLYGFLYSLTRVKKSKEKR